MKRLFIRTWVVIGSFVIMLMAACLIGLIHSIKFFNRHFPGSKPKDPFHDSRQHPLNDPNAPRG